MLQSFRPLGTAVNNLDVVEVKLVIFLMQCSYFTYKFYALQITSRNNA